MLFIQRGTGDPQGDHPDITIMVDWASNTKSLTGCSLGEFYTTTTTTNTNNTTTNNNPDKLSGRVALYLEL